MMPWPEEPQSRPDNSEWLNDEFLESTNFYPSDNGNERAQHGATNFLSSNQGAGQIGLTYSASCPSLSGMDDVDGLVRGAASGNGLLSYPFGSQEPLVGSMDSVGDTAFGGDKTFEMLLQFQQDYQSTSQRQFPHQQVMGQPMEMEQQQMVGGRRGFHGSQSFTSLSSMESNYNRVNANSKRKKGNERWMKLQRHKSFDSATPKSEPFKMDPDATLSISMSSSYLTSDQLDPMDNNMTGLSMNAFSTPMQSNDPIWPLAGYGSAPSSNSHSYMQQAYYKRNQQTGAQSLEEPGGGDSAPTSTGDEPASELDMLLSDNERANLFDAIRDFESPKSTNAQPSPEPPQQTTSLPWPLETKEPNNTPLAETKSTMISPRLQLENQKKGSHNASRPLSLDSSTTLSAGMPPSGSVTMRTRLHQILVLSVQNSDAGSSLSTYERNYLMQSPLFFPAKAPETAGSLWLLLHAAQCESGCEIAGCSVMRRVLNHCLGCELVVGKCKEPCNDAKAMLLHYGSCNSKGSMHGRSCSVCWNLLEIDYSHQALSNGNARKYSDGHTPNNTPSSFVSTSPSTRLGNPPRAPTSSSPGSTSSLAHRSPSKRPTSASGTSKHVPIQPNPLPTASNPMGLMGTLPPHFGYSLSLYLEQTSAPFRMEVKSRIEKRVTAAAGQDLLQHMQKKTRLRSLDDLRSEARTIVLGEMERELHLHLHAYNWANSTTSGRVSEEAPPLPPYLTNFPVAGFGAL